MALDKNEKKLIEKGLEIIRPRASAIVVGQKAKTAQAGEAILKEGMESFFESIGQELGNLLQNKSAEERTAP